MDKLASPSQFVNISHPVFAPFSTPFLSLYMRLFVWKIQVALVSPQKAIFVVTVLGPAMR